MTTPPSATDSTTPSPSGDWPVKIRIRDWPTVIALAAGVMTSIGWVAVTSHRQSATEARVEVVEQLQQNDHDLLIRIDENVKTIRDNLAAKQKGG